jgi:hypothetical protein
MNCVCAGSSVQLAPPPLNVADAVPDIPGIAPDETDEVTGNTEKLRVTCVAAK